MDGKPSIILGLIWTIILQYHVSLFCPLSIFLFSFSTHHDKTSIHCHDFKPYTQSPNITAWKFNTNCVLLVLSDRGVGQRPLVQLPSVLHGVSDQSGHSLQPVEPLGQQQSRSSPRLAATQQIQSVCQEGPAALGPGTVPQVRPDQLNGVIEQIYIQCTCVVQDLSRVVTLIHRLVKAFANLLTVQLVC